MATCYKCYKEVEELVEVVDPRYSSVCPSCDKTMKKDKEEYEREEKRLEEQSYFSKEFFERLKGKLEDATIAVKVANRVFEDAQTEFNTAFYLPSPVGDVVIWDLGKRFKPSSFHKIFYRGEYAIGMNESGGDDGHPYYYTYHVMWKKDRIFAADFYYVGGKRSTTQQIWTELAAWGRPNPKYLGDLPNWFGHKEVRVPVLVSELVKKFANYYDQNPDIAGYDVNNKHPW